MRVWQDELLMRMKGIGSEVELFDAVIREGHQLGFEYCAFGLQFPVPVSAPRTVTYRNHASGWQEIYENRNYQRIDPVVQHGIKSSQPLVWGDGASHSSDDTLREFWAGAREFGLRHGWAQSTVTPGGPLGIMTFARDSEAITNRELAENALRLSWLVQATHWCVNHLVSKRMQPERDVHLSDRERSVLRWTAEGKTSREISDILGIAERTVNFHITSVMNKFNCANKTAATVRAAMLGLLA